MTDGFEPLEPVVPAPPTAPMPPPPPSFAPGPMPPGVGWTPQRPPQRSGMATAAFVLGLASIVMFIFIVPPILAIVFGLIGASQIKKSGGKLTGLAQARWGWALGIVGTLGAIAVYIAVAVSEDDDSDSTVSPLQVAVGDCFVDESIADLGTDEVTFTVGSVTLVECSEPHHGEAYHVGKLNVGREREYPGETAVRVELEEICYGEPFESFVGTAYEDSELEVLYYFPSKAAWQIQSGPFSCVLIDPGFDRLTGSQRGSNK
jgi:hypothetical protein